MIGKIQTVLGLISPEELGPTLMHEHLLIDLNPPDAADDQSAPDEDVSLCNCWKISYGQKRSRRNFRLDDREIMTEEVREMVQAGGRGIVELTVGGLKPDPRGLQEIARASGSHIVMGCGHYVDAYQTEVNRARSVDSFAEQIVGQIREGAWNTDVRAGIIGEIGCQSPWTDYERRLMRGALIAQSETGASINVHPGRHPDQPQEVVDFIRSAGHPVDRVILSHIDRTIFDDDRLLRLADTGCIVEIDMFGWEHTAYPMSDIDMPNDGVRIRMVRLLFDHGHGDRVLISHDLCTRTRLGRFGGHGYQHIYANVVPRMLRRGFSAADIETLLVTTPRRLLTLN